MVQTGLSDVVEWKKPKIETQDSETNTEIRKLTTKICQTEVKQFSQSSCQTDDKPLHSSISQTDPLPVIEQGMQTDIKEFKNQNVNTIPKIMCYAATECDPTITRENVEHSETQTDVIVIKEKAELDIEYKEQFV